MYAIFKNGKPNPLLKAYIQNLCLKLFEIKKKYLKDKGKPENPTAKKSKLEIPLPLSLHGLQYPVV